MVMGHVMQKPMVSIPKVDQNMLRSHNQLTRETLRLEHELDMTVIPEETSSAMEDESTRDDSTLNVSDAVAGSNEEVEEEEPQRTAVGVGYQTASHC